MEHNVTYNEDNLVTLSRMPDNSVDLIITSPPYNKGFYAWIYWIVKDEKKVYFDREKSALRTSIWRMGVDKNPHPAPFPIMMAKNIIACASPEGALIYDPFMGSGTTALATLDIGGGRSYIGSEISEKYCTMAENRIKLQTAQLTLF